MEESCWISNVKFLRLSGFRVTIVHETDGQTDARGPHQN